MAGVSVGVNVVSVLLDGLRKIEYHGYDSAGLAVIGGCGERTRVLGRVAELEIAASDIAALTGIVHTRWATHEVPSEPNAHPHVSGNIAVVHNGIIENYEAPRFELTARGYVFTSDADTESIAHLIEAIQRSEPDLFAAVRRACQRLVGAYAIAVIDHRQPGKVIVAREGSPLLLRVADPGYYAASDASALLQVTRNMICLENGDIAELTAAALSITRLDGSPVCRPVHVSQLFADPVELGNDQHYMQKGIFEQPVALANPLEIVDGNKSIQPGILGAVAADLFQDVDFIPILACGASSHSGYTARYWLAIAGMPCNVEIANEYRYRVSLPNPKQLIVAISQSGETADTSAALRHAKSLGQGKILAICNVPESAIVRECALRFITRAGQKIGIASTKAFSTQLAALFLLTLIMAKVKEKLSPEQESAFLDQLRHLSVAVNKVLHLEPEIKAWALRPALRRQAPCPVSRAWPALPDRHGGGAKAEGNLLHPCRSLSGRRTQARTAGAGRCRHAGDLDRPERPVARQAEVQPQGSAGELRRALCLCRRGERPARIGRGSTSCTCPYIMANCHRSCMWCRCNFFRTTLSWLRGRRGQAAQPSQVGDGGAMGSSCAD